MAYKIECRLKEILDQRGIKQKWLCERVGVSSSAMSQIVRGESEPTLLTTLKISVALDLVTNEIWVLVNENEAPPYPTMNPLNSLGAKCR